jgi:hypothetical protein
LGNIEVSQTRSALPDRPQQASSWLCGAVGAASSDNGELAVSSESWLCGAAGARANYTESPGRARKYNADCDTSILQLDLERGIGRTHRYLSDVATYVRCGAAMRAGDLMI